MIIPINTGFVSHFRSNINKYFKYTKIYPFDFIKVDLEYFSFLIRLINQTEFKKMMDDENIS
jgi:hypothetical protein